MAQITLGALTTLNTSTHLDAMFTDLYGYAKNLLSDGSGNVGIGATPTVKFQVSGGATSINSIFDTPTAGDTRIELRNNGTRAGYLYWDTASVQIHADTGRRFVVRTNSGDSFQADSSGNVISALTASAPALAVNGQMVFSLTSNTNLRISVRGTDGTTRVANITLA